MFKTCVKPVSCYNDGTANLTQAPGHELRMPMTIDAQDRDEWLEIPIATPWGLPRSARFFPSYVGLQCGTCEDRPDGEGGRQQTGEVRLG